MTPMRATAADPRRGSEGRTRLSRRPVRPLDRQPNGSHPPSGLLRRAPPAGDMQIPGVAGPELGARSARQAGTTPTSRRKPSRGRSGRPRMALYSPSTAANNWMPAPSSR